MSALAVRAPEAVAGLAVALAVWLSVVPRGRCAVTALGPARAARAGGAGRRRVLPAVRRRTGRRRDAGASVLVVVTQVAALLRAGAPPGAAWSRAVGVPVGSDGVPHEQALAAVVGGAAHARAVVAATRLALEVGAPLGRVLEVVSDALVSEAEARAERDAAFAGPRATARLLLWLPVGGVAVGWALGADPVATATDGGAGTAAVGLGMVLLAAGRVWTARLVAAARRAGGGPR